MSEWIAFLDFDGTITSCETLSGAIQSLDPPVTDYDALVKRMLSREISLKDGLREIFSQIKSDRAGEFMRYISQIALRPGFGRFLDVCEDKHIPVVVVSGGLDIMVGHALAPYRDRLKDVWSCHLDTSSDTMSLMSEFESDTELVDKNAIIARYEFAHAFCVGDGYTDFEMARKVDVVFARDQLEIQMKSEGAPYLAWGDFFDIARLLEEGALERT